MSIKYIKSNKRLISGVRGFGIKRKNKQCFFQASH